MAETSLILNMAANVTQAVSALGAVSATVVNVSRTATAQLAAIPSPNVNIEVNSNAVEAAAAANAALRTVRSPAITLTVAGGAAAAAAAVSVVNLGVSARAAREMREANESLSQIRAPEVELTVNSDVAAAVEEASASLEEVQPPEITMEAIDKISPEAQRATAELQNMQAPELSLTADATPAQEAMDSTQEDLVRIQDQFELTDAQMNEGLQVGAMAGTAPVLATLAAIGMFFENLGRRFLLGLRMGVTSGVNAVHSALNGIRDAFAGLARLIGRGLRLGALRGVAAVRAGLASIAGAFGSLANKFKSGLKWSVAGLVAAATAASVAIFKLGAGAETTRLSFQTMLGSVKLGNAMMEKLDRFSNSTPYSGDQVNRAAKTLMGFGVEAGNVEEILRKVGDVAAGSGKDFNALNEIFGKVWAKGKMDTEAMNQMLEAGIPIVKVLSQMYGKTAAEIYKMAENSEISAADVSKAFDKMSGKGGVYYDMMRKQSETATGLWGAIIGQLQYAAANIGELILPLVKDVLKYLSGWADKIVKFSKSSGAVDYIQQLGNTAITVCAIIVKGFHQIYGYGAAVFGSLGDVGSFLFNGIAGAAMIGFVTVIEWFNRIYEYGAAAFKTLQRAASIVIEGIQAVVVGAVVWVIEKVISGVNFIGEALNKLLPKSKQLGVVGTPQFVDDMKKWSKMSAQEAKKNFDAIASGEDFTQAGKNIERKNGEWAGTKKEGQSRIEKAGDAGASTYKRFQDASGDIDRRGKAVDKMAEDMRKHLSKWATQAKSDQKARNESEKGSVFKKGASPDSTGGRTVARERKVASDSLTKIGMYNFGPNAVKSLDVERNKLLKQIAGSLIMGTRNPAPVHILA